MAKVDSEGDDDAPDADDWRCACGGEVMNAAIESDSGKLIDYLSCLACEKEWRVEGDALVPFDSTGDLR